MMRSLGAAGMVVTLAMAAATAQAPSAPPPEETPRDVADARNLLAHAPSANLTSGRLRATIALPDPVKGFYRGTRFDWAGMISEVRLGGRVFYGPWFDGVAANIRDYVDDGKTVVAGPQTAATGPAEEFVASGPNPTPGYAEAQIGHTFLKIGVGRLRKTDDRPYNRFRSYPLVDAGSWAVRRTPSEIGFHQIVAAGPDGYGYDYEKTVRLEPDGVLVIAHRLRNTGTKPIATQVYNHNFTLFDGRAIAPGLSLRFPYPLAGPASDPKLATVEGATLRYVQPLRAGEHVTLDLKGFTADPASSGFVVASGDGAQISASSDTPLARALVWSMRRVVAVEPFITIDLAPGAEKSWSWRYTFTDGSAAR